MATYEAAVPSTRPADDTFDFVADFTTTAEWDPSIDRTDQLGEGPPGVGARYRVVSKILGHETVLDYEVVEYDAGARRIVLRGENSTTVSVDTITVADDATVTYRADLTLKGPGKILDPALGLVFNRVGDKAAKGLEETLS